MNPKYDPGCKPVEDPKAKKDEPVKLDPQKSMSPEGRNSATSLLSKVEQQNLIHYRKSHIGSKFNNMYERPYNKAGLTYPVDQEPVLNSIKQSNSGVNSSVALHRNNLDNSTLTISQMSRAPMSTQTSNAKMLVGAGSGYGTIGVGGYILQNDQLSDTPNNQSNRFKPKPSNEQRTSGGVIPVKQIIKNMPERPMTSAGIIQPIFSQQDSRKKQMKAAFNQKESISQHQINLFSEADPYATGYQTKDQSATSQQDNDDNRSWKQP